MQAKSVMRWVVGITSMLLGCWLVAGIPMAFFTGANRETKLLAVVLIFAGVSAIITGLAYARPKSK